MAKQPGKSQRAALSNFILMIGDEGAILIQMQRKQVVRRLFAASADENSTRAFNELLMANPKAPITLLVDMMDQSYIRQTIPPVSSLNVGKIIKRRIEKDFSPDDINGYIVLDREEGGRKDWNFLMVSLANPPLLQKWISFAVERPNPFKGIGLVPIEVQPFILAIEKLHLAGKGKDAKPLEWQLLVSHHKVGGFRQVVLHKGKLIFTRMAQPVGESSPAVIAGNIEQEITNTLEYLKRMGLQATLSLSITVITSEEIKKSLDPKNMKAAEYRCFTPYEIAEKLSMNHVSQPEDHFGDVVISAFVVKRYRLLLPLFTNYTRRLRNLAWSILGTRVTGALTALAILGWSGLTVWDIIDTNDQSEQLEVQHASLEAQLQATKTKAKALPKQINLFTDVVNIVKTLDKRRFDSVSFVTTLAPTLQDGALATAYHWVLADPLPSIKGGDKRQIQADMDLHVFFPIEPHDKFIASATELVDRVQLAFPEFDVTHSEFPGLLSETKALQTVIGKKNSAQPVASDGATTSDIIKITIKGPIAKKMHAAAPHPALKPATVP